MILSDLVFEKVEVLMAAPQHSMAAPPYSASEPEKALPTIVMSTPEAA